jgi:hypothetical protein
MLRGQPWIFSPRFDIAFILAPAILVTLAALAFHDRLVGTATLSPLVWLVLIVGVDVSHVYSTLFRTYLDKEELSARPLLYIMTPILAWLAGCLLYSFGSLVFWRVLAYAAVFHFVRQQYGFMMIYGRRERGLPAWFRRLDKAAIYGATLFPLVYWHSNARGFDWFVHGDFVSLGRLFSGRSPEQPIWRSFSSIVRRRRISRAEPAPSTFHATCCSRGQRCPGRSGSSCSTTTSSSPRPTSSLTACPTWR